MIAHKLALKLEMHEIEWKKGKFAGQRIPLQCGRRNAVGEQRITHQDRKMYGTAALEDLTFAELDKKQEGETAAFTRERDCPERNTADAKRGRGGDAYTGKAEPPPEKGNKSMACRHCFRFSDPMVREQAAGWTIKCEATVEISAEPISNDVGSSSSAQQESAVQSRPHCAEPSFFCSPSCLKKHLRGDHPKAPSKETQEYLKSQGTEDDVLQERILLAEAYVRNQKGEDSEEFEEREEEIRKRKEKQGLRWEPVDADGSRKECPRRSKRSFRLQDYQVSGISSYEKRLMAS